MKPKTISYLMFAQCGLLVLAAGGFYFLQPSGRALVIPFLVIALFLLAVGIIVRRSAKKRDLP